MRNTTGPGRYTWATLVRRCRGRMEVTELARRLGVHRGTIRRWEAGETVPKEPDVVQRFAALFHLDLDETLTIAGLRPASDEVAPTTELRFDPDVLELQRMLDDPNTPEITKQQIREMVRALKQLAATTAAQRRRAG